ncbi:Sec-independent protein translocase protein TatA [Microbacterium oxydans]|jgi:sec-independent protein translocase protein TatA|uniref:Sec-independent protein translocase protein TatA n=1 Tax=Microbacterium oxydans TaxID=82380 RepID=A0A0F0L1G8_9MICO|nr:twin-arginine translocase TatA/TatE family subunit [Microbacterium oxydans]KJL26529.1 Sec-independent protein translocase protein TatA [Microbacterium oxydans]
MFANLTGWHMIILLVVILLLFGAAKLPALAKSVGQSARILKGEIRESRAEDQASTDVAETSQQHGSAPMAAPRAAGPRPTA